MNAQGVARFDGSPDLLVCKKRAAESVRKAIGATATEPAVRSYLIRLIRSAVVKYETLTFYGWRQELEWCDPSRELTGRIALIYAYDGDKPRPSPNGLGRMVFVESFYVKTSGH